MTFMWMFGLSLKRGAEYGGGIFNEYKIRFNCFKDVPFSMLFGGASIIIIYYLVPHPPIRILAIYVTHLHPHPLKAYRSPLHYSWEKGDDSCDGEGEGR